MPSPVPRTRSLMVVETLGISGLLVGGALLAGPGGATLAARPHMPLPVPLQRTAGPAPVAPGRTVQPTALDRNLLTAAAAGDAALVGKLLAAGASPHVADERGRTALLIAVSLRHNRVARALMQAGADVNRKDEDDNSAFLLAARTGQVDLVRLALVNGADLASTDRYRGTALTVAAQHGNVEVVRLLLQAGAPVDHVNALGWTALLEAIVLGDGSARYESVVELLLDAGADPNLADRDGNSPTRHARQRGYKTMVKMLMRQRGH